VTQPELGPSGARKILEDHDLLGRLTRAEMDELMRLVHVKHLPPDHLLFQKGDPGDSLFAVLSGQIKISTLSEFGKEVILNILGPGEIFGEIALLDGKERTADASTIGPSELLFIARPNFMRFLEGHPRVALRLLDVLCSRIRWVSESYEDVVFKRLPSRLAKKSVLLAGHFGEVRGDGVSITLRLPQQELANMVGATRESVNKQMRLWEDAGLITYQHGHITVLNLARLSEIAESDEVEVIADPS
jgi:CRP-like cAMP-binding protein